MSFKYSKEDERDPYFILPNKGIRSTLAMLYKDFMEGKLTAELLEKNKAVLDEYMAIVVCKYCKGDYDVETRFRGVTGEALTLRVKQIEKGFCCDNWRNGYHFVWMGMKMIHLIVWDDKNLPLLNILVKNNCDLEDFTIFHKRSPLVIAIRTHSPEMVKCLVRNYVEVNEAYPNKYRDECPDDPIPPLIKAINVDDVEVFESLLESPRIDVEMLGPSGEPLLLECIKRHEEYVKPLLEAGAGPDCRNRKQETPLWYCASKGKVDLLKLLIEHGADVPRQIIKSLKQGDLTTSTVLMTAGADAKQCMEKISDQFLLEFAAIWGRCDIAEWLIKYGGDPNFTNKYSYSPIHLAAINGQLAVVKILLEAGVAPDIKPFDKTTPLALAAENGHLAVVKLFVSLGCDVNNVDNKGNTPLHVAAYNGWTKCVTLLLQHDADINARNIDNTTALWFAVYTSRKEIIQLLLDANAEMEIMSRARNPCGFLTSRPLWICEVPRSPLYMATERNDTDTVMQLIKFGYQVHNVRWLINGDIPRTNDNAHLIYKIGGDIPHQNDNADLIGMLYKYMQSPLTLFQICRTSVRRSLGPKINEKVEILALPKRLKGLLTLKD